LAGELKYPTFNIRIKNENGKSFVFDEIRKKWVFLNPEEWVRQHLINFLIAEKKVPASMISVEKEIKLNDTRKRYDLVIYNSSLKPVLLVECKSPDVDITQLALEQALRYNLILNVEYLLVSNGLMDVAIRVKDGKGKILETLPDFPFLN
jgi:hypothetical protein